jgi:putative ABC transport system permease protein
MTMRDLVTGQLDVLRQDVAYTLRALRRAPGFAATAITIVALGIGATTAAFSVTDFVLIRPLPFAAPDRLVEVWEKTPGYTNMELSPPNYRDWKAGATAFESMAGFYGAVVTMRTADEPRRLTGAAVSADLLPTLGVTPAIGRTFTAADERPDAPGTLLLSDHFWQTEFGGDPSIVGRVLVLDTAVPGSKPGQAPFTVVGVMPPTFHFPDSRAQFWTPARLDPDAFQDTERANNFMRSVARLRPGVSMEQARAELDVIAARLAQQFPKENKDTGAAVFPLSDEISERSRLLLLALSGAAACVLLIACANLANLLLARALGRRRELAVRSAIGAGRARLARQLMTESLLLAVAGGAVGVGLAVAAVPLLARLVPTSLPLAAAPAVDLRVLLFAAALTVATGVAFGLAPVARAGGGPDLAGLREGSRAGGGRKDHVRSALVVAEVAASVALLVSAGLLVRALFTVRAIDPGFKPDGVLTMRTELPVPKYERVATREAFYTRVLQDVRALPGVKAAGYVSFLPMSSFRGGMWTVTIRGDAASVSDTRSASNVAAIRYVTPGYFAAMGIPLEIGRDIGEADNRDRQFVAVVSESFAKRYWPGGNPIGQHFTFASADREVVGVAGNVRFRGLERTSEPQVYLSSKQVADGAITFYAARALAVRAAGSPGALAPSVRAIVRQADPDMVITDVQPLADMVDLETASRAVQVRVLATFAAIAFALAAIGIHGLLSFSVSQRSAEIGVRMALGAQARDILVMVLARGVALAAAGIVPGVLVAYAAGRSLEALLAGVKPTDAPTMAAAAGLSILMTVLGTLSPTLRALRVDPVSALKAE